jgi:hypothetical protein
LVVVLLVDRINCWFRLARCYQLCVQYLFKKNKSADEPLAYHNNLVAVLLLVPIAWWYGTPIFGPIFYMYVRANNLQPVSRVDSAAMLIARRGIDRTTHNWQGCYYSTESEHWFWHWQHCGCFDHRRIVLLRMGAFNTTVRE